MTREDLDRLIADTGKTLPARPDWREGTQIGTRRAYIPIALQGVSTGLQLAITCKTAEPTYLVVNLLANRKCVMRLCLTGGHRDRTTRKVVMGGHLHRWCDNRPAGSRIPNAPKLRNHVDLPTGILSRDIALDLFLTECGVERPSWWPLSWPDSQVLL